MPTFRRRQKPQEPKVFSPDHPVNFPTGAVVELDGTVYYIKGGKKWRVSEAVGVSWAFPKIVKVNAKALEGTPTGGNFGFRDGSLLEDIATRELYLVSSGKVFHVTNPDTLKMLDLNPNLNAILTNKTEIAFHVNGGEI